MVEVILGLTKLIQRNKLTTPIPAAVAIGNFDGLHLGHQALLGKLQQIAAHSPEPVKITVVMFYPSPKAYFSTTKMTSLMSLRAKIKALGKLGVEEVVGLKFNRELANTSAEDFVRDILVAQLRIKYLVLGEDFRFGKDRRGDINLLRQLALRYNFQLIDVPCVLDEDNKIGSSAIKNALLKDDLELATKLLGTPYTLCGAMVKGDGLGSKLGFATANINVKGIRNLPIQGVYVVNVKIDTYGKEYFGVANVGIRPTVSNAEKVAPRVEVHLLTQENNLDLYGVNLEIQFLHKLRNEQKFASLEELQAQITVDIAMTKQWLKQGGSRGK